MFKTLKRIVLLVVLALTVAFGTVFAVACDDPNSGEGGDSKKVTYSVTVTSEVDDLELTSLKAQWLSGTTPASDEISLDANGKASVELESGNYTVDLIGVPETAEFEKASATAAKPNVTINVTPKSDGKVDDELVLVTINVPAGFTLPAEAKVQAYVDGNEYGEPAEILLGVASVSVPADSNYTVKIVPLPVYFAQTATVTGYTATINVSFAEVDYVLTLDKGAATLDYTTVTATVKDASGATVKSDLAFDSNGKLTVTLVAGSYTVELAGLDTDFSYDAIVLTYDNYEVTVELISSYVYYTAYLPNTLPEGVGPTSLTLVATDEGGVEVARVAFSTSYSAYFGALRGVYILSVEGLPTGYTAGYTYTNEDDAAYNLSIYTIPSGGTAYWYEVDGGDYIDWRSRNDNDPYVINELGSYYIPVRVASGSGDPQVYVDVIKFTAPESGEHSYTFSWDTNLYSLSYMNSEVGTVDDDCLVKNENNGSLIFSLEQGNYVTVLLRHAYDYDWTANTKAGYVFSIEAGDPISEGDLAKPVNVFLFGDAELEASEDRTWAYFAVFALGEAEYKVTFEDGVSVYYLDSNINADITDSLKVESGDTVMLGTDMLSYYYYFYVTAPQGQVKFSLAEYIDVPENDFDGTFENAKQIYKDQEASYYFAWTGNYTDWTAVAWFKFVPDASQEYQFNFIAGFDVGNNIIVTMSSDTWSGDTLNRGENKISLLADVTYYICVEANPGNMVTFSITDVSEGDGLTLGENTISIDFETLLTFTVEDGGTFRISWEANAYPAGVYILFVTDFDSYQGISGRSDVGGAGYRLGADDSYWETTVTAGTTICFAINNDYSNPVDSITFTISVS